MKTLDILCDMDGILCNLIKPWLACYNADYAECDEEELSIADITQHAMHKLTPIGRDIYKYINMPGWFEQLEPLEGGVEGLAQLRGDGHRIFILSSMGRSKEAVNGKMTWLERHAPFIDHKHLIFTPAKHMVRGDVFIDDSPDKLAAYKGAWPGATTMGITWPYNTEAPMDVRADDCHHPAEAWSTIVHAVRELARQA